MEAKVNNGLLKRRRNGRRRRRRRGQSGRKIRRIRPIEYSLFVYLKMELAGATETSVDFCHIARCHIPLDGTLLSYQQLQFTVTAICMHIIICHENMSYFLPYPLYLSLNLVNLSNICVSFVCLCRSFDTGRL